MKTLSIKQPWASIICTPRSDNAKIGIKDIENRTWATKHRGRIYVHASLKPSFSNLTHGLTHDQMDAFVLNDSGLYLDARHDSYPKGAIIGEVDIIDCVINHTSIWAEHAPKAKSCPECGCKEYVNKNIVGDGYRNCKDCGQEWWTDISYGKPIYNWVLANPVLYDKPILNVKGKLSLWEFDAEKEVNHDNVQR